MTMLIAMPSTCFYDVPMPMWMPIQINNVGSSVAYGARAPRALRAPLKAWVK
jgi:hypothetical protein